MESEKKEPLGFCILCNRRLMPVGHARLNGKDHKDWAQKDNKFGSKRMTHKKCWAEAGCPSYHQLQKIKMRKQSKQ